MEYSADRNMYFSLGNLMKKEGYKTYAYHNHTYSYYGRDKSHPNLGYTYKGIGNGLKLDYSSYYTKPTTTRWPNSDYLMALATEEEYMNDGPFHTYYMTVSGHMLYTFMGNSMSSYHKSKVAHLPYSDEVKAYLACQIELDLMVEELVTTLQEKGIADDTVIVLTADHYPYGLQQNNAPDYYSELAGYDTSSTFEKYKNTLIMWHEGLESIVIDEPTYSIDLLPTLCNLFGLEYDSRLLMGRDFLSDSTPLVCFSNRSWMTDLGRYDASSKTFTPNAGVTVPEDYAKTVSNIVSLKFKYADQILKRDYYNVLFGK
jgi:phosphoglycerol transferase MdoB-like AlkP superfamily enzyme